MLPALADDIIAMARNFDSRSRGRPAERWDQSPMWIQSETMVHYRQS